MKRTHTTLTNIEYYETLHKDAQKGETCWTVNRHVKRGDKVLLYVCSPVCAIVATAAASNDAELIEGELHNEWNGHYRVDMHNLQMLDEPLPRKRLTELFPEWGYWKQPRNSVEVPMQYVDALAALLNNTGQETGNEGR